MEAHNGLYLKDETTLSNDNSICIVNVLFE